MLSWSCQIANKLDLTYHPFQSGFLTILPENALKKELVSGTRLFSLSLDVCGPCNIRYYTFLLVQKVRKIQFARVLVLRTDD